MSSTDSGQGESLCTPKRVQKRLFGQNVSSSKRNLFQNIQNVQQNDVSPGEESDLGPMSPLEISGGSSCNSSPGRSYASPFTTPENSPRRSVTWERLKFSASKRPPGLSPFSSLKKLTKEARYTPRKIFAHNNSPKSLSRTPTKSLKNIAPATPIPSELDELNDEIVPETPQKDGEETPQKEQFSEQRLITPLGSVCKKIIVPPLNRRKSICNNESTEESSPEAKENSGKRHSNESLNHSGVKMLKTDETLFIPKARASLFPEDKNNSIKIAPLSAKSFYNNNNIDEKKRASIGFGWRPIEKVVTKKRQSLPAQTHRRSVGSTRRHSVFGQINAGVRHGIKKPKPKRRSGHNESIGKTQKSPVAPNNSNSNEKNLVYKKPEETKANDLHMEINHIPTYSFSTKAERTQPAVEDVPDPNKKFFKSSRVIKLSHVATVSVNNKIKLKVSDGKLARQQKKIQTKHVNKKPKLDPVVFDVTDLINSEEPELDKINDKEVATLLKMLEDDWADDDGDNNVMAIASATANTRSPLKTMTLNSNILMSPASVLSNMTSSMNIADQQSGKNNKTNSESSADENNAVCSAENEAGKKLFPIFNKDHTNNMIDYDDKSEKRGIKRPHGWQLSVKANGDSKQYQIDAGQKRFGSTQCPDCNVVYQIGEPEDENAHLIFHNNLKKLRFHGWKNEHVVYEDPFTRSRIITVEPSDSKHCWNKIEEILDIVDKDLGLAEMTMTDHHSKRVYLYIRDKLIIGVLVAEAIKTAHRMIPELIDLDCCEEEPTDVKCGVNVIWTALSHRKCGIARKLMDILRSHFYYGYIMSIDDIAFSIPTPIGKIFAEKYVGNKSFKVYS